MDLEQCLQEIATGKIEPLKLLYENFRTPVYALILSIVKNRTIAEDLLQETFLKVYTKAYQYKPHTNVKAWIISIARNLSYDSLRNNKIINQDFDEIAIGEFNEFSPLVSTTEDAIVNKLELTKALLNLEKTEREIVVMHVIAGLKHSEIGETLRMPCSTIRWKYRSALKKLSSEIGGNYLGK